MLWGEANYMTILTSARSVHGVWSIGGAPVWGVAEVYPWHCSSDVCGDVLYILQ